MFSAIYSDGKFKPFNESKLLELCNESERNVLYKYPSVLGLKFSVLLHLCNISIDDVRCPVCGNFISYRTFKKGVLPATCSKSCAGVYGTPKRTESMIKNFGSLEAKNEFVTDKQRKNSMAKYGMPFQSTNEHRNKVRATLESRYGVSHNSRMESVKESRMVIEDGKTVNIMHTKQAIENRSNVYLNFSDQKRTDINKKISESIKKSYSYIDRDELCHASGSITSVSESANCSPMTAYRALVANGAFSKSYTEDEISDYIRSLGFGTVCNTRKVIAPKEVDVYVPSKNLAIEYNGIYWHSSNRIQDDAKWSKYHLEKTTACEEKGINLLHIFETEWICPVKREIWKSIISHKLGKSKRVYARKCTILDIDSYTAFKFCEENHLQGGIYGSRYIGLFYNDALVQVAIFGKARYSKGNTELLRLCSLKFTCVVGGASKITKGISFISYGNRRWCSTLSNVYDNIGTKIKYTDPCHWYFEKGQLFHRSRYMKHKLINQLEHFNPEMSASENCYANGLRRIWDCGNILYEVNA